MEQQFNTEILFKLKQRRRRKFWRRALSVMMCIVVFCTTYALILPAITQETETFCGIEAHTHTEDCFDKTLLCENHVHTDECFRQQEKLICTESTEPEHIHSEVCEPRTQTNLTCGMEETAGHSHSEACAPQTQKILICAVAETTGHTHTEDCSEVQMLLSCGQEESEGHSHDAQCFTSVLTCTLAEDETHTHGDGCYSDQLTCTAAEFAGHSHSDSCYTAVIVNVCGMEETDAHSHTDGCYTETITYGCGLEETPAHSHSDGCYTTTTVYSCGLEEVPAHVHGEDCYEHTTEQICKLETDPEHVHTEDCYLQDPVCEKEEHAHSLMCYSNPNADLETASDWEAGLPELSGDCATDVLAIAKSQLGYTESVRNYQVSETGETKGYTRYGAWYGIPYGDWCAMYVSFCLHYAGAEEVPLAAGCHTWIRYLTEENLYASASQYTPVPGDLIFFEWGNDDGGITDHVGLVAEVIPETDTSAAKVITIEGNSGNTVRYNTYNLVDPTIVGYGVLSASQPLVTEDSNYIDIEDADAWAVLLEPNSQIKEVPQAEEQDTPEMKTANVTRFATANSYSLHKTTNAYTNLARAGTPLDLKPFINSVGMYDIDGNPIASGSVVTEGDLIEFKIDYTITGQQLGVMNGEDITVISDTLVYTLPSTFQIVQSSTGDIVNSAGVAVGTYVVDSESGTITLRFSENYVEQNAKGIQIQGKVSFFSTVTKITDSDSEDQNFKFTDDITLGIIINEKDEAKGDLSIEKQKVEVDGEDILYEVKVTSGEGTNGPITITDRMSEGLTFKEGVSVQKGDGTPLTNASFQAAADNSSFTMTLPEMAAGDSYTIRYRCTADVHLLGGDMTVRNTATVTGKDSHDNELKDSVTVDHTFDLLEKTGISNDDGTITWTITVNQAKADISGWTLQDLLTTNNGETPYDGTVTIKGSTGNTVASDVRLPYTFPENSKDTYTITYTTSHDYEEGTTIYNRASLKDDNTDVTVLSSVGIGNPLTKSGTVGEVTQIDGKYVLPITWTVTIDTSIGAIPAGQVLLDTMEDWTANEMYMTYDQLMAAYGNIKAALEAEGSAVSEFEAKEYRYGMGQDDQKYDYNALTGNVNGTHSKLYEHFEVTLGKDIPKGKLITFTYETSGVFENNVLTGSSYTNQFSISDQYQVKSTVQFTAGEVKAKKMALSYYDPVADKDTFWHWSIYDYNGTDGITKLEYEKLHQDYLAWAIELSVPPEYLGKGNIVLYEDLPEGVTLKGLTLPFRDNVPTRPLSQLPNAQPLQLWDVTPGNTYEWKFNLYTAEQYNNWNHQGGQLVTITVKVTEDGDLEITIPGIIFETMAQYAALQNQEEWYAYLHVFTQIDEDFEWTPKAEGSFTYVNAFENRFTVKNEDGDVIDVGSQSQEITKDESKGIIRKVATTDENNIIDYSVVLNTYGKDLIENSGILRVHDELTYQSTDAQPFRLRLVPGSVKLYEARMYSDGSYEKLREVTTNYSYAENSSEQYGITTWTHTIDLNVPDSMTLVLEYSYKADGDKNVTHNVQNTCSIMGVGEGSLDGEHKVEIQVKESDATADIKGVMLYKVDANSDGIFLENAVFNIYIWNQEANNGQGEFIIVHHPNNGGTDFVTDSTGMLVLDNETIDESQFAYNTTYRIVEVAPPGGYYLGPEPYDFYIVSDDPNMKPCFNPSFAGHPLTSGDIIYRENTKRITEISIEKYWKSYNGANMTVTGDQVSEVTLELWQKLESNPNSAKLYGTYKMTPDEEGNWSLTITGLPRATATKVEMNDGEDVYYIKDEDYLYYIKEVSVNGFTLESYENNDGINFGTIKLVNRELEGYELPETGGAGTQLYTTAGLLLMLTSAAYLLYIHKQRRREASS